MLNGVWSPHSCDRCHNHPSEMRRVWPIRKKERERETWNPQAQQFKAYALSLSLAIRKHHQLKPVIGSTNATTRRNPDVDNRRQKRTHRKNPEITEKAANVECSRNSQRNKPSDRDHNGPLTQISVRVDLGRYADCYQWEISFVSRHSVENESERERERKKEV